MSTTDRSRPVAEVVAGLGTIVGVWAHPDDEAYLAAGLMAAAVEAGARVVCVTATRGERGTSDPEVWPPERLAALREAELTASLAALGVREHLQLAYPDGACADVPPDDAVGRLVEVIADVRPDTVLTFGPDGMTGHVDHRTVSAWTTAAVVRSTAPRPPRLLYAAKTVRWCDRFESLDRALGISRQACRRGLRSMTWPSTSPSPMTSSTARWPPWPPRPARSHRWWRRWAETSSARGWPTSASGPRPGQ